MAQQILDWKPDAVPKTNPYENYTPAMGTMGGFIAN
jgi:hypothetical protein